MSIKRNRLELSSELGKHILSVKAFRDYLNNFLDSEIKDPQEILKLSSISTEYLSNYLRPMIATSPCYDESDDDKDSIFKLFDEYFKMYMKWYHSKEGTIFILFSSFFSNILNDDLVDKLIFFGLEIDELNTL